MVQKKAPFLLAGLEAVRKLTVLHGAGGKKHHVDSPNHLGLALRCKNVVELICTDDVMWHKDFLQTFRPKLEILHVIDHNYCGPGKEVEPWKGIPNLKIPRLEGMPPEPAATRFFASSRLPGQKSSST